MIELEIINYFFGKNVFASIKNCNSETNSEKKNTLKRIEY